MSEAGASSHFQHHCDAEATSSEHFDTFWPPLRLRANPKWQFQAPLRIPREKSLISLRKNDSFGWGPSIRFGRAQRPQASPEVQGSPGEPRIPRRHQESPGAQGGPGATGEPRGAQASPGESREPRGAQESPGEPRRAQESPGEPRSPRRPQESPEEPRQAQGTQGSPGEPRSSRRPQETPERSHNSKNDALVLAK